MPKAKMPIRRANSGINQQDVMPPLHAPKLGRKTIKLNAYALYKTCWPNRIAATKRIAIRNVKKGETKKSVIPPPNTPYYRVTTYSKDQKHDHKVTIFMPEGLPFTPKSHVITDCDCADAAYRFEYTMAKKFGTAFIWRCNGEPPVQTNPRNVPGMCKHTRLALTYLLRQYKSGAIKKIDKSKTNTKLNLMTGKSR